MNRQISVALVGTWLYDGAIEKSVRILQQNWDYYFEEGYDDDPPDLNPDGYAFYAVYGPQLPPEPANPRQEARYALRSRTCLSLEEAIKIAEESVEGPIAWGRLPTNEI